MSKNPEALRSLPPAVQAHLRELGANLAIARQRRREPRRVWAQRIGVSEPTLTRMEQGDPSVSMAVWATALWLMGRAHALPDLAAPEHDRGALEADIQMARQRSVRTRPTRAGAVPPATPIDRVLP